MSWECLMLLCLLSAVHGETVPFCFVPSGQNTTAPRPRTVSQYPNGPSSGQQDDPCFPSLEKACNPSSCLYGFESNSIFCSCKCFDPCANKRCNEKETCVVMQSPNNTFYGSCILKTAVCPKLFCEMPECRFGYELDGQGCQTCECKNPCLNFGCPSNHTCQIVPSSNGTLMPFCVDCPKMDCRKTGVCPQGLAKNKDGCDVCECHGCPCIDDSFSPIYCTVYFAMDEKTGCELDSCAIMDCEGKCTSDEVCVKKYTRYNRVYGVCERRVKCPDCSHVDCDYGLKIDSNGCNTQDCLCYHPCEGKCEKNEYCVMSPDDCINKTDCRDAPMPYCKECPSLSNCQLTSKCPNKLAKDSNGCSLCQCLCSNASCPLYCVFGNVVDSITGCELCECKPSPCVNFTCNLNEVCKAEMNANGRHEARCVPNTTYPCKPSNCSGKNCLMGFEKDAQGCILPSCTCYDLCKKYACPPGTVCKITPNDCVVGSDCRDGPMPYCEAISTTTATTTITPDHCPKVNCELGCIEYRSPFNGCPACNCTHVDPCEGFPCDPTSQQCRVQMTACPANSSGKTIKSGDGKIVPYCIPVEVPKCICIPVTCQVVCPFGKVRDSFGCDTCTCFDPCASVQCLAGQLCQIVEYQNCKNNSCSSFQLGVCMDAYAKRNIRMKINASFEVYVLGTLESLTRQVIDQLSVKYGVKKELVTITTLEKGSILVTADVLYQNSDIFKAKDDQTNFNITLGNQSYSALILSFRDENPSLRTTNTSPQFLTHGEIILIVLLCVLVPLAIIASMIITYFICVYRKRRGGGSIKSIMNTSCSEISDSLPVHSKCKHEDMNAWSSTSSDGSATKESAKRPISFTEA